MGFVKRQELAPPGCLSARLCFAAVFVAGQPFSAGLLVTWRVGWPGCAGCAGCDKTVCKLLKFAGECVCSASLNGWALGMRAHYDIHILPFELN